MPYKFNCVALPEDLLQGIEEKSLRFCDLCFLFNYSPIFGPISTWQPPPPIGSFVNGQAYTKSSWVLLFQEI